jgi:hypothetical protein
VLGRHPHPLSVDCGFDEMILARDAGYWIGEPACDQSKQLDARPWVHDRLVNEVG